MSRPVPKNHEMMLTSKDAAAIFNVSQSTVRRWLGKGYLKGNKIGPRCWIISQQDLDEFRQSCKLVLKDA